jgi:polysaccharide pyruvyl transferase WcaK-like protein
LEVKNLFFITAKDMDAYPSVIADPRDGMMHEPMPIPPPERRFSWPWTLSQIGRRIGPHSFGYFSHRGFQRALASRIGAADLGLEIGGDNYSLDYGLPLAHASLDAILSGKGIPVVLWSASVGPFGARPRDEKWMMRHLQAHARMILVREPGSLDYLRKMGLGQRTFLMGDPGFVMAPSVPRPELWNGAVPQGSIGINLSPLLGSYRDLQGGEDRWLRDAGLLIRKVRERFDRPLLLIPHVMQFGNDDHEFMLKAVRNANMKESDYSIVSPELSAAELKWIISGLDLLIAARTHAAIAALSSHVPTISIAYSVKAYGLNRQLFGNQDLVIPVRELGHERLLSMVDRVIERSEDIRNHLADTIPGIKKAAFFGGELLRLYVENGNRLPSL